MSPEIVLRATKENFDTLALRLFRFHYGHNELYRQYCDALHTNIEAVTAIAGIPFLPISFFKTHRITTDDAPEPQLIFESSGTTGDVPSRHYIADAGLYERSLLQGFGQFYGAVEQYAILALLPSYLERANASLVYMAKTLMQKSKNPGNGFYISEWDKLRAVVTELEHSGQKALLLGVTFALLDFAMSCPMRLRNTVVMETGGMKGRREELTRSEVHAILKRQWQPEQVHSEYGMTELLSQAYSMGGGIFRCTDTMKMLIRDINDPLDVKTTGDGCLNVIDLANLYSCPFIATEDLGRVYPDGSFEVLGRMDNSALRGCNLMVV